MSIPGTKRKGVKMVQWDMRLKPPKAARGVMVMGEAGVFAGAIGPMASPGNYRVRLNTPPLTDEWPLTLVPDPLSPGLDYAKRREISGALFTMVEELGFLEARVKALKDSAEHRAGLVKNKD